MWLIGWSLSRPIHDPFLGFCCMCSFISKRLLKFLFNQYVVVSVCMEAWNGWSMMANGKTLALSNLMLACIDLDKLNVLSLTWQKMHQLDNL